jgi:hypothetical protein
MERLYKLLFINLFTQLASITSDDYAWHLIHCVGAHIVYLRGYLYVSEIQSYHAIAYHGIMSQTYDDSLLDNGTSTLNAMMECIPKLSDLEKKNSAEAMMKSLCSLFSPTASRRSVTTAAIAIIDYKPSALGKQ